MKRVLVLGATGAMATYLIPNLLEKGFFVTGVALDGALLTHENYEHISTNAYDIEFLKSELARGYDGIVDFLIYNTVEMFDNYYKMFLESCEHYIFFSTYRVYSGAYPITEQTPRLLDVERPADFVTYKEYSIYKAEEEDVLKASPYNNFTIVRPAITYSKRRFQLVTLEAGVVVHRMLSGKTVILPEGAMNRQATMSWAGDVARMLSCILFNKKAYRETYTVSTAEHNTWREVAEMYAKIGGLKYITVPDEDYVSLVSYGEFLPYARQQLYHDRCYDRVVDNSKILALMGEEQSSLMPLCDGLSLELEGATLESVGYDQRINEKMDEYLKVHT